MKRKISMLLVLAMLAAMTASCGEAQNGSNDTTSSEITSSVDTEETSIISSALPDTDLNGATFRVATWSDLNGEGFYTNEENGDVVNDAVYAAMNMVKDKYNATIEPIYYSASYNDVNTYVVNMVQSGDDVFDIIHGHSGKMWQLSTEGYFQNIRELEYNDFTKPWWPSYLNDTYEINGKQYIFASYFTYRLLGDSAVMFMNKSIADDYKIDIPYSDVKNGEWTLDKFSEMVKQIYSDLDNDGTKSENDMYGFAAWEKSSFQAAYSECYKENDNGELTLDYDQERMIGAIEALRSLFASDNGYIVKASNWDNTIFTQGRALFYYGNIGMMATEDMRANSFDFGILPVPKYDLSQDDYKTPSDTHPFGIPVTVQDTEKLSLLLEAYSSVGYNYVREKYFEQALQNKYSRDDDSIEMLNIISNTITADLAILNTPAGGFAGLGRVFLYAIQNPDAGIASYLASLESSEKAIIDSLNEFFAD